MTGIGGTGVITVGALISMAAHIEGKGVTTLDHTGVAQKNGAVMSHIRIAEKPEDIHAVRIAAGEADAVIGCDLVVTSSNAALAKMGADKTRAIVNTQETMTAGFIRDKDLQFPSAALLDIVGQTVGDGRFEALEATAIATRLMGDSIATNMFMLGYALQKGHGAVASGVDPGGDRAERRRRDGEQAGARLGPSCRGRPRCRAQDRVPGCAARIQAETGRDGRRDRRDPAQGPDGLPERRLGRPVRKSGAGGRGGRAGQGEGPVGLRARRGAELLQADGLTRTNTRSPGSIRAAISAARSPRPSRTATTA